MTDGKVIVLGTVVISLDKEICEACTESYHDGGDGCSKHNDE